MVAYHDTREHKPHPQPLLEAMKRLKSRPDRCFYIGDQDNDMQAALNAQITPIGLSWNGTLDSKWVTVLGRPYCSNWNNVLKTLHDLMKSNMEVD